MFNLAYIKFVASFIFIIIGVLLLSEFIAPVMENIKMDAWIREDPSEPPVAILKFVFNSKWGFFSNSPIHVKVQIWVAAGENASDVAICFPDAYAYPINQTPSKPPHAGWIPIRKENNFTGEGDIIFTYPGTFDYIIYSEGKPVYYAAEREIIQISPPENLHQIKITVYGVGIALISLGLSVFILPKIRIVKKRKTTKKKLMRKCNHSLLLYKN
ncbi:MAG: hypothetical protein RMI79_06360 [Nitrososphaerota archaeon]|nr:hypothetical protein [Nitrososphaerota archaeon]